MALDLKSVVSVLISVNVRIKLIGGDPASDGALDSRGRTPIQRVTHLLSAAIERNFFIYFENGDCCNVTFGFLYLLSFLYLLNGKLKFGLGGECSEIYYMNHKPLVLPPCPVFTLMDQNDSVFT